MENLHTMPLLPLRNLVVFPNSGVSFDVIRPKSIKALEEAMSHDKLIFLVTQIEVLKDNPSILDLYKIGVVAKINQMVRLNGGTVRVMVD